MTTEPIHGTPEGRPGIWLIDPAQACALIDALPDDVHNFIGGDNFMVGADWTQDQAREFFQKDNTQLALVFPPNHTMQHQLVAINDENRWSFDVGVIDESRMVEPARDTAAIE